MRAACTGTAWRPPTRKPGLGRLPEGAHLLLRQLARLDLSLQVLSSHLWGGGIRGRGHQGAGGRRMRLGTE